MSKEIDLSNYKRKNHYEFFKVFSNPFLGLTANLNCTQLVKNAKTSNSSLYLSYMHKSLLIANNLEEFKHRIVDDKLICYDEISASPTVLRPDKTFGFGYFPFKKTFSEFAESAAREIARVSARNDLEPAIKGEAVIHYTTIPWLSFTQIIHPSHDGFKNSIPKISFGKIFKTGTESLIPVSVEVHHALMDGYHVGQYFEQLQQLFDQKL